MPDDLNRLQTTVDGLEQRIGGLDKTAQLEILQSAINSLGQRIGELDKTAKLETTINDLKQTVTGLELRLQHSQQQCDELSPRVETVEKYGWAALIVTLCVFIGTGYNSFWNIPGTVLAEIRKTDTGQIREEVVAKQKEIDSIVKAAKSRASEVDPQNIARMLPKAWGFYRPHMPSHLEGLSVEPTGNKGEYQVTFTNEMPINYMAIVTGSTGRVTINKEGRDRKSLLVTTSNESGPSADFSFNIVVFANVPTDAPSKVPATTTKSPN
jgi:uncharacterized coiled-coil protein SlyX